MLQAEPTLAVVLTPEGRGAVATVLVTGPQAVSATGQFFRPAAGQRLAETAIGRIRFGRWGAEPGEEIVVCRRGPNELEIHCHGGVAAVRAIVAALVGAGCQPVPWTEWRRQATTDAIEADAAEDLARATTLRAATVLVDQWRGALRRELTAIVGLLTSATPSAREAAHDRLLTLQGRAALGRHLVHPFRVVLAGPPNAGKSSLINALVGYPRAIVHPEPGTTRDIVTANTALAGWPVELADTAGLRMADDPVETSGVQLAEERLASADLRLLVFDRSRPWNARQQALVDAWPTALVVHNKSDLPEDGPRPAGLPASALIGPGIDELQRAIGARLVPHPPAPGAAVPFRESHVAAVDEALKACRRGDWHVAGRLILAPPSSGTSRAPS
jgi:tRNA modification GTPase